MFKIINLLNYKEKNKFFLFILLSIFASLIETFSISIIIPIVSKILEFNDTNHQQYFGQNFIDDLNLDINEFIIYTLIFIFALYLLKNLFLCFYYYFLANLSHNINLYFSNKLYKSYLSRNYIFHITGNTSEIVRNLSSESKNISSYMMSLLNIISDVTMTFFICLFLVYINPLGAIFTIILITMLGVFYFKISSSFISNWAKIRISSEGKKIQNIQETFKNIKEIIIRDKKEFFYQKFYEHNKNSIITAKNISFLQSLPRLWLEIFVLVGILSLFLINLILGKTYSEILVIFAVFAFAIYRLMPISSRIIQSIHGIKFYRVSVELITKEISTIKKIKDEHDLKRLNNFHSIEFKDVSFKYDTKNSEKIIFKDLNLKIMANQFIGIKGISGSGKSTFIDLFTNLIQPDNGKIIINEDLNIEDLGVNWRKKIGYVTQQSFLIDDTIKNNITFGEKLDESKIKKVIKFSFLEKDIEMMKIGLDTRVGENGNNLSGGQIQRLMLARSIYNDRQILILDEPTSSLDKKNENDFFEYLNTLKSKYTIILISHEDKHFRNCDKIFEVNNYSMKEK